MQISYDITQYNANYSHEFSDITEILDIHINMLYNELIDIYRAIYIFEIVQKQWIYRYQECNPLGYSSLRTTLYESLIYRIVIGVSKIFANSKEYSLIKAVNQLEQQSNDKNVKKLINEIHVKYQKSKMIADIRLFRDKFFAHLDKECVISEWRVIADGVMKYLSISEIEEWIEIVQKLYEESFKHELSTVTNLPSEDEILSTFRLN